MDKPIASKGWSRILFFAVQFTWGLTVNLAGLLVFLCLGSSRRRVFHNSIISILPGNRGGLSLGVFIFVSAQGSDTDRLCAHEYGHTVQCLFLGPLYWPLVLIPSALWYHFFAGFRCRRHVPYDSLYCERLATAWGEKWSGVKGHLR